MILIYKIAVKMNARQSINFTIITKNHAADPEIWFLTKSISKPYGRATAMPTAWELRLIWLCQDQYLIENFKLTAYWTKSSLALSFLLRITTAIIPTKIPTKAKTTQIVITI